MKTNEQLLDIVDDEFSSGKDTRKRLKNPVEFYSQRLMKLWYMFLKLKNRLGGMDKADRIEPLTIGKKFLSVGSPFYEDVPPNGVEMANKINEIIERLNSLQEKDFGK